MLLNAADHCLPLEKSFAVDRAEDLMPRRVTSLLFLQSSLSVDKTRLNVFYSVVLIFHGRL